MNPDEFKYLASRLAEHGAFPAEFRTAISRAYYAVFHVGLNLLKEMDFNIARNSSSHEEVTRHFNNSGDNDLIKAGSKINDLRTRRLHADYELNRKDVEKKQNSKMLVQMSIRLIDTINKCCGGENRDNIIKSIQDWKHRLEY